MTMGTLSLAEMPISGVFAGVVCCHLARGYGVSKRGFSLAARRGSMHLVMHVGTGWPGVCHVAGVARYHR